MEISEYKNIFENEQKHFFYVGNHYIFLSLLKKYLRFKKTYRILDAGCGTGFFTKKLAEFGDVVGVDIHPQAIKFAKQRGVLATKASITKLPFKDNFFDVVFCLDVLYHQDVKDDLVALRELRRVLKPSGILIIKVPAYNWLRGNHDMIVKTKHRYTKKEIVGKIKEADLIILKSTYITSFLLPFALIKRLMENIIHKGKPASDITLPPTIINTLLIFFFKLEYMLINTFSLPFGLSILVIVRKKLS